MKRAAHLEWHHALGTARFARRPRLRHGLGIARDHGLVGRVQVGGHDHRASARRGAARRLDLGRRESEHGRHRARALRARLLHQFATAPDQGGGVGGRECPRGDVRRVFAEGVSRGRDGGAVDRRSHDGEHRRAVCQDRRLRVLGCREPLLGSFEHQPTEREAQGLVDRPEGLPRLREPLGEVFGHPDFLCTLSGAEPNRGLRGYHCTTRLAQVSPAPNAQNITFMPGLSRPQRTASSSAIATDAADVLP